MTTTTAITNNELNGGYAMESFAENYYLYGRCLSELGRHEEAMETWQKGLSLKDEPGNHK